MDLGPVDETVAGEDDGPGLRLAPGLESFRPLARPAQRVHVLAAPDDHAVDDARHDRRELARGNGDHRFVEQREAFRDPLGAQEHLPLEVAGEGHEIPVREPLADAAGFGRDPARRLVVPRFEVAPDDGQEQVAPQGAVMPSLVEQPLRARHPARRAAELAGPEEPEPEPERGARGREVVARFEVRVMGALEDPEEVLLAPHEGGGPGQPVEVLAGERSRPVRRGQGVERLEEVSPLPRLAAAPEVGGSVGVGPTGGRPSLPPHVAHSSARWRSPQPGMSDFPCPETRSDTTAVNIPRLFRQPKGRPMKHRLAAVAILLCAGLMRAEDPPKPHGDKPLSAPPGADPRRRRRRRSPSGTSPTRRTPSTWTVPLDVDTGTWMSLDVSPDGKEIVFDLLGDIYVMPIAGGEARALTSGIPWDMQPRYSPDGKWIAFTSDRSGGDNIWIVDRDGKNPQQVTKETFRLPNSPAWTPDCAVHRGAQALHRHALARRGRDLALPPHRRRGPADDEEARPSRRTTASPRSRPTAATSTGPQDIDAREDLRVQQGPQRRRSTSSSGSTARPARSSAT